MEEKIIQKYSLKQMLDRIWPDFISKFPVYLKILKSKRVVSIREIADLILFLADTSHREWDLEMIMKAIGESENINWREVFEKFLETDLKIWNTEYLYTLIDTWVNISGIITVPYEIFFKKWPNRENQIEFFKILLESDHNKTQIYSNIFFEKLVTKEQTGTLRDMKYESNFNCVELFHALRDIDAYEILEYIQGASPEYFVLGLARLYPAYQEMFEEGLLKLPNGSAAFPVLLSSFTPLFHVLHEMKHKITLTRLLDILLEHKALPRLTEVIEPYELSFDIAILSSRRDHLNLELWLGNLLGRNNEAHKVHALVSYLESKTQGDLSPLTPSVYAVLFKVLKNFPEFVTEETLLKIKDSLERDSSVDKGVSFITEIINNNVEDSLSAIQGLLQSKTEEDLQLTKRIFSLLIDNYCYLFRLPNSDKIALFFGELIKNKLLLKPFSRIFLALIKHSLLCPGSEREFLFALKILEIFFNFVPSFYNEIHENESIVKMLIKKDLLIIDEDNQKLVSLSELVRVLNITDDISQVDLASIKEAAVRSIIKTTKFNFVMNNKVSKITNNQIILFAFSNLSHDNNGLFSRCVLAQPEYFRESFMRSGFMLLNSFFNYKLEDELLYVTNLGSLLGAITIGINRPVNLNLFDFGAFISKGVEQRRLHLCLSFVSSFLKQGTFIFKPFNPWVVNILDTLSEIYAFSLKDIRKCIKDLFMHFNLEIVHKETFKRDKFKRNCFVNYNIEYEGIKKQVIMASLDFSIREICNRIIKTCLTVTSNTAVKTFLNRTETGSKVDEHKRISFRAFKESVALNGLDESLFYDNEYLFENNNYKMFKNLFINLSRSLIHISSQEPLKASMCGNISHFLKLSALEIPLDGVYEIISKNLKICCGIIEKAGVTAASEMASSLYLKSIHSDNNTDICGNASSLYHKSIHSDKSSDNSTDICGNSSSNIYSNSLRILDDPVYYEKTFIKNIENVEYQELRTFLLQIGNKIKSSNSAKTTISIDRKDDDIYHSSILFTNLLNESLSLNNRINNFDRMLQMVSTAPDKDEQCLSLCKYLIGHVLKKESPKFVYEFIFKIFNVSVKTRQEVVSWLIYSTDIKKFNIPLILKFIEYDFLCVEEFDQSLSRFLKMEDGSDKFLGFILNLLNSLILSNIRLCTVYDFIYTIEVLNKMNENPRVFDFFKKIETEMLKFNESDDSTFDSFVKSCKFANSCFLSSFMKFNKDRPLSFRSAFRSCYLHFVLYSGSYRYFKVDILSTLVKMDFHMNLRESLKFFVQALAKRHCLFFHFFCRFIVRVLDTADDTPENRVLFWKFLNIINVPSFICQFLEVLSHKFVVRYFEKGEFFYILKSLFECLHYNRNLENSIYLFFSSNMTHFKKWAYYLNILCPDYCVDLKNLFNITKIKDYTKRMTYVELIDSLGDQGYQHYLEILKGLLDKGINTREIILTVLCRLNSTNAPMGIKQFAEEITKRMDVKDIVSEYNAKYFNKMT